MQAIVLFFNEVGQACQGVPLLSSVQIRREMFKLYYMKGSFDLNEKADAFEALDFLLTCIHSWVRQCEDAALGNDAKLEMGSAEGKNVVTKELAKLSAIRCGRGESSQSCFIHEKFFLAKNSKLECVTCKQESS